MARGRGKPWAFAASDIIPVLNLAYDSGSRRAVPGIPEARRARLNFDEPKEQRPHTSIQLERLFLQIFDRALDQKGPCDALLCFATDAPFGSSHSRRVWLIQL